MYQGLPSPCSPRLGFSEVAWSDEDQYSFKAQVFQTAARRLHLGGLKLKRQSRSQVIRVVIFRVHSLDHIFAEDMTIGTQ